MKLFIVLATYNGARFIEEQIISIQQQTVREWTLLIRDDGSGDDTASKIRTMQKSDPRIVLIEDEHHNLGVAHNFAALMQKALEADADYIAFADQDDIWQTDKLNVMLQTMQRAEAGQTPPVLIHSDLEVVNEALQPIHPSFIAYRQIAPQAPKLETVLCQNIVTGAAMMINRALLNLALPIPNGVALHDWWLALLALATGKLEYIDQPLVRYRQHSANVIGVRSPAQRLMRWLSGKNGNNHHIAATVKQAALLHRRLQTQLAPDSEARHVIERYMALPRMARAERLHILRQFTIVPRSALADWRFKYGLLMLPHEAK